MKQILFLAFFLICSCNLFAQVVTGSMTDSLVVDSNSNTVVNPGDVIRYKTTISVSGSQAGNVNYSLPLPLNTTGIAGSIKSSALARQDSMAITVNGNTSGNLLTNDFGLPSLAVTSFGPVATPFDFLPGNMGTSTGGGNLTIQSNGTFMYSPATNFTGFDYAKYNVSTGFHNADQGTFKVRVGEPAAAFNDSYDVLGNVSITVPTPGFLSNDTGDFIEAKSINGSAALLNNQTTTATGGLLTAYADGSIVYLPFPGFEGIDSFTYTVDNGFNAPSTGKVYLNVSGMIWFINNNAPPNGNGRLSTPFNSIAAFNSFAPDDVNDNIFIRESSTPYSGSITLLNGQKLIGQDASATLLAITGLTMPTYSANLPTTNAANGTVVNLNCAITLGSGNTLRGFNVVTNGSVTGNNFGTCNISDFSMNVANTALDLTTGTLNATISSLTSTAGDTIVELNSIAGTTSIAGGALSNATLKSVFISGGTLDFTYSGDITHNGSSAMVEVKDHNTGTITFQTGTLNATAGTGLQFNNADGNYLFNGTTTLNGGDAGIDIINGCAGSFTFADSPITNPTGPCVYINSCTPGTITHAGTISKTSVGRLIEVSSNASGNITFNGNLSSTSSSNGILVNSNSGTNTTFAGASKVLNTGASNAISITTNSGTTTSFTNGGLDIDVTSGIGFNATSGGTISVQGTVNTITTVSSTALNVNATTISSFGLTFQSLTSPGGTNGVVLNTTGSSGGLTVTGTGSPGSGGSLNNHTGDAISLSSCSNVNLSFMNILNSGSSWIQAANVNGLNLNNISADLSKDAGIDGSSIRNLTMTGGTYDRGGIANTACNIHGIHITNLLGTSTITGSKFRRSNTIQFWIENNTATSVSGTADQLTVSGTIWEMHNQVNASSTLCAGDHLSVSAASGSNFKLIVNSSAGINTVNEGGSAATGGGIGVQGGVNGSGKLDVSITGLKTTNNTAGVVFGNTGSGTLLFNVFNNHSSLGTGFSSTGSMALILSHVSSSGTSTGSFTGNSISHSAGPSTNALQVINEGFGSSGGTVTVNISNNTINGNFQRGIHAQARIGTSVLNATISNNTLNGTDPGGLQGINVEAGASGTGHGNMICLNMQSNNVTMAGGLSTYRLRNGTTSSSCTITPCNFALQNFSGSGSSTTDVVNWIYTTKSNIGLNASATANYPFTTSPGCPIP